MLLLLTLPVLGMAGLQMGSTLGQHGLLVIAATLKVCCMCSMDVGNPLSLGLEVQAAVLMSC